MPSYVIADMLGIPLEDGVALYELTETIHAAPESQAAGAGDEARSIEMFNYARGVWERKRAEPGDDLATLIASRRGRRPRRSTTSTSTCSSCCSSTPAATPPATWWPAACDACSTTPTSWRGSAPTSTAACRGAVEELLRWVSPVVYMRRTAMRDTELGGVAIGAGDKVVMYYGSANRDEAVFGRPPSARPGPDAQRARRVRRRRPALLPRRPHRPHRDRGAAARAADPAAATSRATGADRVAAVDLHLRPEAPAGRLHRLALAANPGQTSRLVLGCRREQRLPLRRPLRHQPRACPEQGRSPRGGAGRAARRWRRRRTPSGRPASARARCTAATTTTTTS